VSLWKFVEKFKSGPPKNAREFMGFPVELEWKEVGPSQDDRIMADGRPAYAWWNEIQMLRARGPELEKKQKELADQFKILRIAEWVFYPEIISDDILLRIKRLPLTLARNPETELLEHPEKYISIESAK
jgi:hypothetical protein